MDFKKMLINFRKKGYSGIIPFVYVGKEEIHKFLQYEISILSVWAGQQIKV